jgi:organic radical activating enzyme
MNSAIKKYSQAYIEITSACNFKCSFCPSPTLSRKREMMDVELFRMLAPQVAELCNQTYLHVMGEPLLHPHLDEIVQICKDVNLPVSLTTNGSLLIKNKELLISALHLRQINISLHALKESRLPRSAHEMLEEILDFCVEALVKRPDLYINLRLWNLEQIQGEDTDPWNAQIRSAIRIKLGVDLADYIQVSGRKSKACVGRVYLHMDSRFEWPSHSKDKEKSVFGSCRALNTHFAVLVDGRVVPCCLDEEGGLELGRVTEKTLLECLEGERAQVMREGFATFKLVEPLCQSCQFCKRFSKPPKKSIA